ncbi:MAG: Gmad2 immunoglobulin-like domain-containing protein [Anaerolineales bacterium]
MSNKRAHAIVLTVMVALLAGCGVVGLPPATATPTSPPTATETPTEAPATIAPTEPGPGASPTAPLARPWEAIAIQQPAPGSTVASPLRVEGVADPTFEQHLGLRLYRMTGELLAEGSAIIEAPLGERGPFAGELTFETDQQGPALLQVYNTSARDGGLTHLSSVSVTLSPSGEGQIQQIEVGPEQIAIEEPAEGAVLTGGVVQVSGIGQASFEGTLVVEVLNAEGQVIGQQPLIVDQPEMGEPGPFQVEVSYQADSAGPGRVVVYDPSPAFDGIIHLNSVGVELQP